MISKDKRIRIMIGHYGSGKSEFAIPGGVFISEGHCWAAVGQDGIVKIGIDDFAKKLLGKIDGISFPNIGMNVAKGEPLFTIKQGNRSIRFLAPVTGVIKSINHELDEDLELLDFTPYEKNWICSIDADHLDTELPVLKIGKTAVNYYQEEIDKYIGLIKEKTPADITSNEMYWGQLENLEEKDWYIITSEFFNK